ncbi:unnamed protein product [Closterium sp. NIES-64]|nr:unnamed protein product [Closterium sp. NIES-64]
MRRLSRPIAARTGPSPPFAASRAAPTRGFAALPAAPPPNPWLHRLTRGFAALPAALPPYLWPRHLTCGPATLSAAPPPYLRPRHLTCGPATLPSAPSPAAAPPATRATRAASPSRAADRRATLQQHNRAAQRQSSQAARQLSRPAAEPPSSRAAQQPSRPAAEPPSSRAAQQPSRPAAEPPSSRAAEPPSSRAAESPSRPTSGPPELPSLGRAIDFEVWVDDLQLFLQCDRADGLSLFDLTSGASPAPAADADATYKSAQTLYDAVVARYSSPATAALSRLMLPYLFPDLAAFPTVADLITHLRTSDTRYRAALPADFCAKNPPPMYITLYYIVTRLPDSLRVVGDHFLSVCPTTLTIDLLEKALLAIEKSIVAVGASRARDAALARARGAGVLEERAGAVEVEEEAVGGVGVAMGVEVGVEGSVAAVEAEAAAEVAVGAEVAEVAAVEEAAEAAAVAEAAEAAEAAGVAVELVAGLRRGVAPRGGGFGPCTYVLRTGDRAGEQCGGAHPTQRCFGRLTDAWRHQFPEATEIPRWGELSRAGVAIYDLDFDAILSAMYAVSISDEGDCYRCFPPNPGIETAALGTGEAAALGACDAATLGASVSASSGTGESALSGTTSASASLTFTLDSGASRSFFRDRTTLTLLSRPVAVSLADPSGGPVLSRFSTVLPCLAAPSGTLSGLYLPSFSTNLVSGADLQDAGVHQQGHERYFLLIVDDYSRYTAVFPLRSKGDVTEVRIDWIRAARLQLRQSFGSDFPVLRLHSDRGGEFSSGLLRAYCRARGIRQTFTLPDSPQQNRIAERRIGMVMDVARTFMMHAAAPHFMWPFAVRYAAHQINLYPRVSRPETSPALLWTGKVGDASAFRFYHPTSRRVLSSQDVTFDESVPYYSLFPYCTPSLPPPALFLVPGPPPVDPLLPQGPTPSGVSQVDAVEPVEITGDSNAAEGAEPGGADSGGAEPGGAGPGGAEPRGAEPGVATPGGAEPGGAKPGGAEPGGAEHGGATPAGALPAGAGPGGAEPRGAPPGGSPGASSRREPLSPQELREWFARRWSRAAGAEGSSATEGAAVAGPGGARTVSTGAARPTLSTGAGAAEGVDTKTSTGGLAGGAPGAARGSGGAGGAAGAGAPVGGTGAVPAVSSVATRPRPYFVPLLQQVLGLPPSTGPPPPLECPQPVPSQFQLQPTSPLRAPSPYTGPTGGLAERREPASLPTSPVRAARASGRGSQCVEML